MKPGLRKLIAVGLGVVAVSYIVTTVGADPGKALDAVKELVFVYLGYNVASKIGQNGNGNGSKP